MTKVDGIKSKYTIATCGVPKGSILGPLLFILYIDDMPLEIENAKCNLNADDSALSVYGHTVDDAIHQLNHELKLVTQ